MPALKLNGEHLHDSLSIQAVMLWPNPDEEEQRRHFWVANEALQLIRTGQRPLHVSPEFLNHLLDAPSWEMLKNDVAIRTKRAVLAGHVMASLYVSRLIEPHVAQPVSRKAVTSVSMACDGAVHWAETMGTYGDGKFLPTDKRKWEKCFYEFRNVSHLWAAKELLPEFTEHGHVQCFSESALADLTSLAAAILDFGTTFKMNKKSKRGSSLLLRPSEIWKFAGQNVNPFVPSNSNIQALSETPFAGFLRSSLT